MSTVHVLSQRELNRTTLRRQLLLERADLTTPDAVAHLIGLQAQAARPPFVGVWTRTKRFTREHLATEIQRRNVVKASLMRATLHLCTTQDFRALRGTLQPVLTDALRQILRERGALQLDVDGLVEVAREFIHAQPRSFAEITTLLTGLHPDTDAGAMRYAVRTHLPMVQVPVDSGWSYPGNPKFALAEDWLEGPLTLADNQLPVLIKRYLAVFGPATPKDMETWSYLTDLAPAFDALRPELVVYHDERRRELFDVPGGVLESADAPAPVRFLPEFDNLLLAHQDRTRVVPTGVRKAVYLPGLRIAATVLIDGVVGATWTSETVKKVGTLRIVPLGPIGAADRKALLAEAERLVRFAEPDAESHAVVIGTAPSP
jgi:hypothetical protein